MRRRAIRRPHVRRQRPTAWRQRFQLVAAFLAGFFLVAALPAPLRGACQPGDPGELLCTGGCPDTRTPDKGVFRLVVEECRLRASDFLKWLPKLEVRIECVSSMFTFTFMS
jgi:hypothetical protein